MRARRRVACTALRGDARVVFRGNFCGVLVLSGCVLLCAAFRARANMACVNGGVGVGHAGVGIFVLERLGGISFAPIFPRAPVSNAPIAASAPLCVCSQC